MAKTDAPPPEQAGSEPGPAEAAAGPGAAPSGGAGSTGAAAKSRHGRPHRDNHTSLLVALACVVIIIVGMRYAASVLGPIFLALFVVMGLSPVTDWLRSRGVPAWLTITIVLVFFLVIAGAFVAVLVTYAGELDSRLDVYQVNLTRILDDADAWFAGHGIDAGGLFSDALTPERIVGWISSALGSVVDAFSNIVLIILIVMFMLAQVYSFPRKMYARLELSKRFEHSFREFGSVTRSYLFTKGWLAAVAAIVSTAVYYAFGVDFALLWGLVFFALSFIPNFGFIISVIPPFAVTLLESSFTRAVLVVVVVVAMNTLVDNVLAPRFMGRSVGLSTLAVFLSLVVWAWILGPVGALMSVPLTLMAKLLFLDSYESTRSLSLFLTSGATATRRKKKRRKARTTEA